MQNRRKELRNSRMYIRSQCVGVLVSTLALSSLGSGSAFVQTKVSRQLGKNKIRAHSSTGEGPLSEDRESVLSDDVDSKTNGFPGITYSPGEATQRLGATGPTVWTEFSRISQEYDPVNLGQGFPDWLPPKFAVDSLVEAVLDSAQSPHQYTRSAGHPNLVKQLARRYSIHMKREIDPMSEVTVTVGASQALYLSLQTLIKPGESLKFRLK
jgi:DNA-binding transcriptional MocR family regulator